MNLFEKIATSLYHGLEAQLEKIAGPGHGDPWKVCHHVVILAIREAAVLWGASSMSLSYAIQA